MKYIIALIVLLVACSNPVDTIPTEYTIVYGCDCSESTWIPHVFFNPETGQAQQSNFHGTHFETISMIGTSGQILWIEATSDIAITAFIRVDGEIVVESIAADSVYAEWMLP